MKRWAMIALLAAACRRPQVSLSCERFGTPIDVRDFGACGVADVDQKEAIGYAEQLAKSCGVPVKYCASPAGKP